MSRYRPYPAYKKSGLKWPGEIPTSWSMLPVRWIFQNLDGKRIPLNSTQRAEIPGDVPYWGSGGICGYVSDVMFTDTVLLVGEDGAPFFDPNRDVSFVVRGPSWINNHIHAMQGGEPVPMAWYCHAFNCVDYSQYIEGSTRHKLTQDGLKQIKLPVPEKNEGRAIVIFLRNETTRIDALIEKKTRFIKLLKEKRQALITHAVTKGLDPNVKMKDSGVEWIGEVPEHWEIISLGRVAVKVKTGGTPSGAGEEMFEEDGSPWYTPGDFSGHLYLDEPSKKLSHLGLAEVRTFPKDSVMLVGIGATIGKVAISSEQCSCNQQINAIIPNCLIQSEFLARILSIAQDYIVRCGKYTTLPIINQEDTKALRFGLPPITEQGKIVSLLRDMLIRIDQITKLTANSIELLKERRSALITAAVTGQIDLREAA